MSRSVVGQAYAKVNLTLEVLGKRADGYHELSSVFATIALADTVRVAVAPVLDVRITPDLGATRGDDLASRAVRAFAAASGREARALVRIRKRIPVAAGLGGGSSDAAAVLRGLSELWHVPPAAPDLAATLGSDIPFFASGSAFALVSGRGEAIAPLPPPASPLWIVLVIPPVRLLTRDVFAGFRSAPRQQGPATRLAGAFRDGTVTPDLVRECARNDLDDAAMNACEWIGDARERSLSMRDVPLHLSGSGPSLYAIADHRAHALRLARGLRRAGLRARPFQLGVH